MKVECNSPPSSATPSIPSSAQGAAAAVRLPRRPDFGREVYCLLGLPFDAVRIEGVVERLRRDAAERRRCFFSTTNLNIAMAAQHDPVIRDSVLRSDLSVVDGMPLVWIARLLEIPLPQRVAGSTLFEHLRRPSASAIAVYLFGGSPGVAAQASERLNREAGGVRCVGHDSPGFGSVEDMSGAEVIGRINRAAPDFLVVSIGARKGQAWIARNESALSAPLISYLGAVINFAAGTVRRAPVLMQRAGLEWLWRIVEEPSLWRRYFSDGIALAKLLLSRVLPYAVFLRWRRPTPAEIAAARFTCESTEAMCCIRLNGAWSRGNLDALRTALDAAAQDRRGIEIDLREATYIDSAVVALISLLWMKCRHDGRRWVLACPPALQRILRWNSADYVLSQ